jgi:SAM-dependent methyltransferase
MEVLQKLFDSTPTPIRKALRPVALPIISIFSDKYNSELKFWKSRLDVDGGTFSNSHYEHMMLAMAGERDAGFLKGKVVADFGCGPRGSLVWATTAALRIGIDVLADRYADMFTGNILSHGMIYLKSTEKVIPLPSEFVDTVFTLNAMDHVSVFADMCREVMRILKPRGDFIGSFNIGCRASATEPQSLNEKIIEDNLLKYLDVKSYRLSGLGPDGNLYAPLLEGNESYQPGEEGFLWVRGIKRLSSP